MVSKEWIHATFSQAAIIWPYIRNEVVSFRKHVYKYKYASSTHILICANNYLQSSCKWYNTILSQCYDERSCDEAEKRVTPAWGVREVCIVGSSERHRLQLSACFLLDFSLISLTIELKNLGYWENILKSLSGSSVASWLLESGRIDVFLN